MIKGEQQEMDRQIERLQANPQENRARFNPWQRLNQEAIERQGQAVNLLVQKLGLRRETAEFLISKGGASLLIGGITTVKLMESAYQDITSSKAISVVAIAKLAVGYTGSALLAAYGYNNLRRRNPEMDPEMGLEILEDTQGTESGTNRFNDSMRTAAQDLVIEVPDTKTEEWLEFTNNIAADLLDSKDSSKLTDAHKIAIGDICLGGRRTDQTFSDDDNRIYQEAMHHVLQKWRDRNKQKVE